MTGSIRWTFWNHPALVLWLIWSGYYPGRLVYKQDGATRHKSWVEVLRGIKFPFWGSGLKFVSPIRKRGGGGVGVAKSKTTNIPCHIFSLQNYCKKSPAVDLLRLDTLTIPNHLLNGTTSTGTTVLLICKSSPEGSTPPSPPPLLPFLISKLTETRRPRQRAGLNFWNPVDQWATIHFSFQLSTLQYYLLNRQTKFMPYELHHSNQWQSLFCSFCSLQVWNCFWLDIITNNWG